MASWSAGGQKNCQYHVAAGTLSTNFRAIWVLWFGGFDCNILPRDPYSKLRFLLVKIILTQEMLSEITVAVRTIFRDAGSSFTASGVRRRGIRITGYLAMCPFNFILRQWVNHPKYGCQFAGALEEVVPTEEEGIICLASR